MRRLIEKDPKNSEVIFPYIGGKEVNTSPVQKPHRGIIDFGERSEAECRQRWPDLMTIVEAKVKPERSTKDSKKYPRMVHEWWKYWNPRPKLQAAIAAMYPPPPPPPPPPPNPPSPPCPPPPPPKNTRTS